MAYTKGPEAIYGWLKDVRARMFISQSGWVGDVQMSQAGQRVVDVIQINWQDLDDALAAINGFSVNGGDGKIIRVAPMQHPRFPWLHAAEINTIRGIDFIGTENGPLGPMSTYELAHITVTFTDPPYFILPDSDVRQAGRGEWERWVIVDEEPDFRFNTVPGHYFQWPADHANAALANQQLDEARVAHAEYANRLTWLWVQVPYDGLYGDGMRAQNIVAGLGKLNATTFADRDPGTLLLVGWKPKVRSMPIPPAIVAKDNLQAQPLAVDVQFHMLDLDLGGGFGHNYARDPTGVLGKPHRKGDPTKFRFEEYEFADLFKLL